MFHVDRQPLIQRHSAGLGASAELRAGSVGWWAAVAVIATVVLVALLMVQLGRSHNPSPAYGRNDRNLTKSRGDQNLEAAFVPPGVNGPVTSTAGPPPPGLRGPITSTVPPSGGGSAGT